MWEGLMEDYGPELEDVQSTAGDRDRVFPFTKSWCWADMNVTTLWDHLYLSI